MQTLRNTASCTMRSLRLRGRAKPFSAKRLRSASEQSSTVHHQIMEINLGVDINIDCISSLAHARTTKLCSMLGFLSSLGEQVVDAEEGTYLNLICCML